MAEKQAQKDTCLQNILYLWNDLIIQKLCTVHDSVLEYIIDYNLVYI